MSKYDWVAPIWGTIILQPFAYAYCVAVDVEYLATLGPFTVLSTIYLMPMYAAYWWFVNQFLED